MAFVFEVEPVDADDLAADDGEVLASVAGGFGGVVVDVFERAAGRKGRCVTQPTVRGGVFPGVVGDDAGCVQRGRRVDADLQLGAGVVEKQRDTRIILQHAELRAALVGVEVEQSRLGVHAAHHDGAESDAEVIVKRRDSGAVKRVTRFGFAALQARPEVGVDGFECKKIVEHSRRIVGRDGQNIERGAGAIDGTNAKFVCPMRAVRWGSGYDVMEIYAAD